MKIASGVVATQSDYVSTKTTQSSTTVANANIRDDRTDPDGRKIEMSPSGDRVTGEAYSVEINASHSSNLSVFGPNGSLTVSSGSSLSFGSGSFTVETPEPNWPGPVVVAPIGFEISQDEIKNLVQNLPDGRHITAIEFRVPGYDPNVSLSNPGGSQTVSKDSPAEMICYYRGAQQAGIKSTVSSPADPAFVQQALASGKNVLAVGSKLPAGIPITPIATGRYISQSVSTMEIESTSYQAQGRVQTADGRTISFDLHASQTRSFAAQYSREEVQMFLDRPAMLLSGDPLRHLAEAGDYILDYDPGKAKSVLSLLQLEGGVLAMDKNKDGQLSSEHELFGATTGNALDELAAYDEDGNGWIDENDSVFKDLLIWKQDETGTARLVSLLDADVGAIYLNYQNTPHGYGPSQQLTASTVYLKESGGAGIAEHIWAAR